MVNQSMGAVLFAPLPKPAEKSSLLSASSVLFAEMPAAGPLFARLSAVASVNAGLLQYMSCFAKSFLSRKCHGTEV
jgi:hypothetical protein